MTYYGEITIGHDEHGCPIEMIVDMVDTSTDFAVSRITNVTIRGQITDY